MRDDAVPDVVGLGEAVEEEERGFGRISGTVDAVDDYVGRGLCFYVYGSEVFEHLGSCLKNHRAKKR